jgi:hypothetical protein
MRGLLDGLERGLLSPLGMMGLGLAGGGFQGASQGLLAGFGAQRQRAADDAARQRMEQWRSLAPRLAGQHGITPLAAEAMAIAGPDKGSAHLLGLGSKQYDSHLDFDKRRRLIPLETGANLSANKALADYRDSLERAQLQWRAQNDPQTRAAIALKEAQAKAYTAKDSLNEITTEIIRRSIGSGAPPPAAPPQQPMPGVQPQSYSDPPMQPMPGVVLGGGGGPGQYAADPNVIPAQAAPGAGQAPAQAPPEPMVDVPGLGRMPKSRAEALAFAYAAQGKAPMQQLIMGAIDKAGGGINKEVAKTVDEKLFNSSEQMARLGAIRQAFDEKFLTWDNKAKQWGVDVADRIGFLRNKIPPAARAEFSDYVDFQRKTVVNLNNYIKEMTGAAMAEAEAQRLMRGVPNTDDGPEAFRRKLNGTLEDTKLVILRMAMLKKQGFKGPIEEAARDLPLSKVEDMYNRTATRIQSELRRANPRMSPREMSREVRRRTFRELGEVDL